MRIVPRVFIVGAGRAGRSLAQAWREHGIPVVGVRRRGAPWRGLRDATVVVVAVRDSQLPAALQEIATAPLRPGAVVLHTSGALDPAAALGRLRRLGHPAGTLHPIVPLARPARAAARLAGAWIGVEGDAPAVRVARSLAAALGARCLRIPAGERVRYHAAAVMAANFTVVLAAVARRLLAEAGVPAAQARGAVFALLRATVANLAETDAARALTGPAVRGDTSTIARHVAALASDRAVADAYRAMTRLARQLVSPASVA